MNHVRHHITISHASVSSKTPLLTKYRETITSLQDDRLPSRLGQIYTGHQSIPGKWWQNHE